MENITNICLISGNLNQRQEVIKKVKNFLVDYDYIVFDETFSIEFIEREINNFDCFGGTKLFIINDFPLHKGTKASLFKKLKNILEKMPSNHYVILNNLKINNKSFLSFIDKVGKVYNFHNKIDKMTAIQCISDYFENTGKEISQEAIDLFVNTLLTTGEKEIDLDSIFNNTYKIESFIGNRKKITKEDILNVCDNSDDFIIWTFFDYLDEKKIKNCLFILDKINKKSNNIESNIIPIIRMLYWRYKLLLYLKECKTLKYSKEAMLNSIGKMYKLSRKNSDYRTNFEIDYYKNGNPKLCYSEKVASIAYEGNYYNKPSINFYSRKSLYLIMNDICCFLSKMRGMSGEELNLYLQKIIFRICERC